MVARVRVNMAVLCMWVSGMVECVTESGLLMSFTSRPVLLFIRYVQVHCIVTILPRARGNQ
jgi:hypothetical protein